MDFFSSIGPKYDNDCSLDLHLFYTNCSETQRSILEKRSKCVNLVSDIILRVVSYPSYAFFKVEVF